MNPELINWLDKLTFTSFLLIAVYFLYRDSRSADKAKAESNTEAIRLLTEQVKLSADRQTELVQKIDQLLWRLPTTRPLDPAALKRIQESDSPKS